ncbi:MAG: 50S ribosomal protein L17 [Anaeromyxobacteraceae bacterium]
MKHRVVGRRLDRTTEHRTAMLRNLVTSLLEHERIKTTTPKAKELKRFADKIITLGKKGTAHARRTAAADVQRPAILAKLFDDVAARCKSRPGGYTRIIRVGRRAGDNADMSMIELVDRKKGAVEGDEEGEAKPEAKAEKTAEAKPEKKAAPKAAKKKAAKAEAK